MSQAIENLSLRQHGLPHHEVLPTRRDFLARGGAGFGALAAAALLGETTRGADAIEARPDPLAPKKPHYAGKARSVIFLFMEGGPSHIDTFDPKPALEKLAGKPLPESFGKIITAMGEYSAPIMASKRAWKQHGQSGTWVSDWLPHMAECVDDFAALRSCVSDGIDRSGGVCQMNTGSLIAGRPCLGSWVSYGLGSENRNLPSFVVMQDNNAQVVNGPRNWAAGFMPAVHQGTRLQSGQEPIPNLMTPGGVNGERQKSKLDFLDALNQSHLRERAGADVLEARIKSYELAFRMQSEAPGVVDIGSETEASRALYGMDDKATETYGRMCLLGRRLVERGVRFVQLYHGAGSKWDAHSGIEKNHAGLCRAMDKPVAGLLKDLKSRGLLESTLVIWGGEFGRTPMSEKGDGRDHNPTGFTMWVAGGGVKGGQVIGSTDEIGLRAVDSRLHVHDLHATFLHLLGVDHTKLTYFHKGRPERATLNEGEVYRRITG